MITLLRQSLLYMSIFLGSYGYTFGLGKDDIIPKGNSVVPTGALNSGTGFLDDLAEYVKDTIFGILVLIVIGMFIYIGFQLIIARGQPDKFGEAMKSLVYTVVGIFVVSIAWVAVRLISSLNIN